MPGSFSPPPVFRIHGNTFSGTVVSWQPIVPVQTGGDATTLEMQARFFVEPGQKHFLRLSVSRP